MPVRQDEYVWAAIDDRQPDDLAFIVVVTTQVQTCLQRELIKQQHSATYVLKPGRPTNQSGDTPSRARPNEDTNSTG
jgi:hypothetical protein